MSIVFLHQASSQLANLQSLQVVLAFEAIVYAAGGYQTWLAAQLKESKA